MPVRPDIGDEIQFLDEIEIPALPVLTDDSWDVVDTDVADQVAVPNLVEQRISRRYLRGLAANVRGEAA